MPKRSFVLLLIVAVTVFGGQYAWQAYEDHQKATAWETLLDGADCSACAARKAGIAAKQEKKRAAAEAESGQMSLIEALKTEPVHDHADHAGQDDANSATAE